MSVDASAHGRSGRHYSHGQDQNIKKYWATITGTDGQLDWKTHTMAQLVLEEVN